MESWKNETRPVARIRPCLRKTTRIIFWEIFFRARRFQSLTESINYSGTNLLQYAQCSLYGIDYKTKRREPT